MSPLMAAASEASTADWITAVCALVAVPSVVAAVVGVWWEIRKDKRQQTLDFIRMICDQLAAIHPQQFMLAVGFDGGQTKILDSEQIGRVCKGFPFPINSADQRALIVDLLGPDIFQADNPGTIRREVSVAIRKEFRSYLNTLEQAALAWHQKILVRDILEEQIGDVCDAQGELRFQDFFDGLGGAEAFPNLAVFIAHLRQNLHATFPPR